MIKNSIVLVPFPFDNFQQTKVRPALCLTSEVGHLKHVIIAFISSNTNDRILNSDFLITKDSEYWPDSGLAIDSVVRLHKLVTIPKAIIKRRLGRINEPAQEKVQEKLSQLFEI